MGKIMEYITSNKFNLIDLFFAGIAVAAFADDQYLEFFLIILIGNLISFLVCKHTNKPKIQESHKFCLVCEQEYDSLNFKHSELIKERDTLLVYKNIISDIVNGQDPFENDPEWVNFKVQESDGCWYRYSDHPYVSKNGNHWTANGGQVDSVVCVETLGDNKPNPFWKNSLIQRKMKFK